VNASFCKEGAMGKLVGLERNTINDDNCQNGKYDGEHELITPCGPD
jgi:hypothetical protein